MNRLTVACVVAALTLGQVGALAFGQDRKLLDQSSGSSVEIEAITPPIAQALVPGTKVKFLVEVRYTLAADSGSVALLVQKPEPPTLAYQTKSLAKGDGKVTMTAEIEVPRTRRIDVNVALYHTDGRPTAITDSRIYEVVRQ